MKLIQNRIKIVMLFMLLFQSCKMKSQVFGYGDKCEIANSIELAKVIYECIDEDKLSLILNNHTNYEAKIIAYFRVSSEGRIISVRVKSAFDELNDEEIESIISKLSKSKYRFKKCVNDLYFKTDEKTLLDRVIRNYNGEDLPIGVFFPGSLLKNDNEGNRLEKIKRYMIN